MHIKAVEAIDERKALRVREALKQLSPMLTFSTHIMYPPSTYSGEKELSLKAREIPENR